MPFGNRYGRRKPFFLFPVIALFFLLFMGAIVMLLWNAILPELFPSVQAITYWQAVGLLLLCRILFGNFRKGGPFGGPAGGPMHRHRHWKEKWKEMTPEEREEMKRKWQGWWQRGREG